MTDEPPADDATDDASDDPTDGDATTDSDHARDPPQPMTDDTDATDRRDPERTATDAGRTGTDAEGTDANKWTEPVDPPGSDRFSTDDLRGLLDRVGLAALALLAVVAGWGFYTQSGDAIRTWFDPAYQSVALAVFNLAVLLVALAGVTHQLRRIRATESGGSE